MIRAAAPTENSVASNIHYGHDPLAASSPWLRRWGSRLYNKSLFTNASWGKSHRECIGPVHVDATNVLSNRSSNSHDEDGPWPTGSYPRSRSPCYEVTSLVPTRRQV